MKLLLLALFLAFTCVQAQPNPCEKFIDLSFVRMNATVIGGVNATDKFATYPCIAILNDQPVYVEATAFIEDYLIDFTCNSNTSLENAGWNHKGFSRSASVTYANSSIGGCSQCDQTAQGTEAIGHCIPCTTRECTKCNSQDNCLQCKEGFILSGSSCQRDTGLSQTVIVVIVVCSVLGTVFISLVIASVALVVYIVKFTKTQPIAHRRLREDRDQPVVYRRKNTPGNTLRQNPVFGDGDGGTANPTFDKEAEPPQPWNNPVRRTRPPITQLQTDPAREGDEGDDDSSTLKTEPTLDSDSGRGTSSAAFSGDAQYETYDDDDDPDQFV